MFRLIFWGFLFYFGYKFIANVFRVSGNRKTEVKGARKGKSSLDLRNHDVEDADFEDIE